MNYFEGFDNTIERLRTRADRARAVFLVSAPIFAISSVVAAIDFFDNSDESTPVDNLAFAGISGLAMIAGKIVSNTNNDTADGLIALKHMQR